MADEQAGGGGTPAPGTGDGTATPKVVAYENFQAVVSAKSNLEAQVKALQGQLQGLTEKAATVDTLSAQVREWQGKAEQSASRFTTYTEFSGVLGTTDADVISVFDGKYEGLPKTDRPTRKDWIESLRAKPDGAPALLRPWLSTAAGPSSSTVAKPTPKVPGTPATPPGAPSSVSAEEVARVREEAVKSGDWCKWKEMRKSMGIAK